MVNLFGSIFDEVYSIIKKWQPRREYSREEGYRDELLEFLRKELNKPDWLGAREQHLIQKEAGRQLADIGVDRKVGIELKLNLKKKGEADRLIGQVKGFLKDYEEGVIIVLCGRTNKNKVEYVRDLLSEYSQPTLFGGKSVKIVIKSSKKISKRQLTSTFDIQPPKIDFSGII